MALADYAGRKADLNVMRSDPKTGLVTLALVAHPDGGQLCVGIQKLFQRYMRTLLLKKGSMLYKPTDGCTFMTDLDAGLWRTTFDVGQSFISAQLDVRRQLLADEVDADPDTGEPGDPDDERFADAELTNIALTVDRVGLTVRVTSLAGTTVEFIVPIVTAPR